jgi:hypothetical protein
VPNRADQTVYLVVDRFGGLGAVYRETDGAGSSPDLLNELGRKELSSMPKNKPTAGPMRTQPIERASIMPTPVLPMMDANGWKGQDVYGA